MKTILVLLFDLFLFSNFVYAYGLASSYLENNTMILSPGEVKEYQIELQNSDAETNFQFNLESEIAEVVNKEETYAVGGDKKIKTITIRIEMPEDAISGQEYTVKYSAVPLGKSDKAVGLNIMLSNEFKVRTPEIKKKSSNKYLILPLVVILMAVFLLLYNTSKRMLKK